MELSLSRRQTIQLAVAVAGGWAASTVLTQHGPIGREVSDSDASSAILNAPNPISSGSVDASVHLAVFSDYRCPACRRSFPEMEAAVAADGDVLVIYKDWPIFGPSSEHGARVALATVGQGIYPAVHRSLMSDNRIIDDAMLRDTVERAGGDWRRVQRYMADYSGAISTQLRQNREQAFSIGLTGTPGYLAQHYSVLGALDRGGFARLFKQVRRAETNGGIT